MGLLISSKSSMARIYYAIARYLQEKKRFKTSEDEAFYFVNEVVSTVTIELEKLGKANMYNLFYF